jgi:hypothetical protein
VVAAEEFADGEESIPALQSARRAAGDAGLTRLRLSVYECDRLGLAEGCRLRVGLGAWSRGRHPKGDRRFRTPRRG